MYESKHPALTESVHIEGRTRHWRFKGAVGEEELHLLACASRQRASAYLRPRDTLSLKEAVSAYVVRAQLSECLFKAVWHMCS